ncbi:hypothetical protein ACFLWA_09890 [Chloroflexota bacterium]
MKKRFFAVTALVVMLVLPGVLYAQETDPISLVHMLHDNLSSGEVDAALALLAVDAVVTIVPHKGGIGLFTGKEEIAAFYEELVAGNSVATVTDCQLDGETVTCTNKHASDDLQAIGVDFIEGEWVGVVQDGKIQSYTLTVSPESLAKFPPPPEAIPVTGGPGLSGYGAMLLVTMGGMTILGGLRLLRRGPYPRR